MSQEDVNYYIYYAIKIKFNYIFQTNLFKININTIYKKIKINKYNIILTINICLL